MSDSTSDILVPGQIVMITGDNGCMDHVGRFAMIDGSYLDRLGHLWYRVSVKLPGGSMIGTDMRRQDLMTGIEYVCFRAEDEEDNRFA